MNIKAQFIAIVSLIFLFCGCNPTVRYGGQLSKPEEAHINLSDDTLSKFDDVLSPILFRYLASNPRWEVREERGLRYAVRRERGDGEFETTLNGFYSYKDGAVNQTRVLISFGREYGFGRERGNITRTKPGKKDVPVVIEGERIGTPGNSSYTIINGGGIIFLEIYDQAPELSRMFTQQVYKDISDELKDVIAHCSIIKKNGILPVPDWYPKPLPTKSSFEIKDGMQKGIYLVSAAVGPTEPGFAYVKAFNVKTGKRLSKQSITPGSIRYLGWSEDGKTLFNYGSEVTIYEGNWSSTYKARFELWHRSKNGTRKKLAEKTRVINGWER